MVNLPQIAGHISLQQKPSKTKHRKPKKAGGCFREILSDLPEVCSCKKEGLDITFEWLKIMLFCSTFLIDA